MIEIIREDDAAGTAERRGLPKDIKQIGRPDIGDRIYVEDQVYQQLHPYDSLEEKRAYVLLGRYENYAGRQCIFVEASIALREITFDGGLPMWNDHTWAYIYKQLRHEYDSMVIVGWALDIKGQLPNMTVQLEALHQANFGGAHQVLFLMDSLEREEAFYSSRNGHLCRRDGFYIYYERENVGSWQDALPATEVVYAKSAGADATLPNGNEFEEGKEESGDKGIFDGFSFGKATVHRGSYRKQIMREEEPRGVSSYASTLLLTLVVCALGVAAYSNNEKMEAMEETLAQMSQTQMDMSQTAMDTTEDSTEQSKVYVENISGDVQPLEENAANSQEEPDVMENADMGIENSAEEMATDIVAGEIPEEPEAADASAVTDNNAVQNEAAVYLAQGYYIVQKGDSLVGICRKIYQTTAMLDKLCEVNGIEDRDAIYAGQYLVLPN